VLNPPLFFSLLLLLLFVCFEVSHVRLLDDQFSSYFARFSGCRLLRRNIGCPLVLAATLGTSGTDIALLSRRSSLPSEGVRSYSSSTSRRILSPGVLLFTKEILAFFYSPPEFLVFSSYSLALTLKA